MRVDLLMSDWRHPQCIFFRGRKMGSMFDKASDCAGGDFLFLVCCTEIVPRETREKYRRVLVLHESDVPQGRGWSPLAWQLLNGAKEVTISMLEAEDAVDSGRVWMKNEVSFEGHELNAEIHERVARLKLKMIATAIEFEEELAQYAIPQAGDPTYYDRRSPVMSQIPAPDDRTFNLMRIADARFPVYFEKCGHRYKVTLEKMDG